MWDLLVAFFVRSGRLIPVRTKLGLAVRLLLSLWLVQNWGANTAMGGEPSSRSDERQGSGVQLVMKTLGGLQFWSDVHFFHAWRIQKNVFTGHYRLLDGKDYRYASGTLEACRQRLEAIRKERNLLAMSGKAVVLVHGIVRTAKSMNRMREPLEKAGYSVFAFGYPSTRVEIQDAAKLLHQALTSLEGIDEIDFVAHSMGGLVVRACLAEHPDPRVRRMVMLGVPNLGAQMADRLKGLALYRTIFGPAGKQLVSDPDGLIARLPIPDFEFAVIAGARGTEDGYNPLVPGDDDGTVGVASTRLPGAADFMTVNSLHSFLMNSPDAIDGCVCFLQTGRLGEHRKPEPIPRVHEGERPSVERNAPEARSRAESEDNADNDK